MILYLLQITFLWSVFSLVYHFILSKKTIYVFNRSYLLLTFIGALLIPLIPSNLLLKNVNSLQSVSSSSVNVLSEIVIDISNKTTQYSFGYFDVIWIVYSLGFVAFMIHFIIGLIKIKKLKSSSHKIAFEGITVCKVPKENQAFSFFKTVFIHEEVFSNFQNNKAIWLHEKAHVQQFHSFDVLLVEFIKIIFWFHPLIYLYRKNIKMNHEYLADEAVLKETTNIKDYQHKLINYIEDSNLHLACTFNYKLTQKRIIMMTVKTKKPTKVATKIFTFFAVFITVLYIACSKDKTVEPENKIQKIPYSQIIIDEKDASYSHQDPLKFVEQKAQPSKGMQMFFHEFARKYNVPKEVLSIDQGEIKLKLNFVVEKDGSLSDIHETTGANKFLAEEGIRVLKSMSYWIPGEHEGKIVRSTFTLPITIRVNPNIDVVN